MPSRQLAISVARSRRNAGLRARALKQIRRVQILGGPMHGYTMLLGPRTCAALDTHGRRAALHFGDEGYTWQTLPSGEQRVVCKPSVQTR